MDKEAHANDASGRAMIDSYLETRYDDILQQVETCIAEALFVPRSSIRRDAGLVETLGVDSIDFIAILSRIHATFGVRIDPEMIDCGQAAESMGPVFTPVTIVRLVARHLALRDGFVTAK